MDIDIDGINQGLVDPLPGVSRSLFSGEYRILTIKNIFSNGKFEQKLTMARYMNADYARVFAQINNQRTTDPVSTSQTNQSGTASTNTSSSSATTGGGQSSAAFSATDERQLDGNAQRQ